MSHRPASRIVRAAAVLALAVGCASPAFAAAPPALTGTLTNWTAAHPSTGVAVARLDPAGPTEILAFKPDIPRRPASTMKIATAASALISLGPNHRFQTRLYTGVQATYSTPTTLNTVLYLKGYGDPMLANAAYDRRYLRGAGSDLAALVRPLKAAGIRRIHGPIVVDETFLDRNRRVPGWPARYTTECQPLSAMSVNQGWLGNERRRYVRSPATAAGVQLRVALRAAGIVHTGPVRIGTAPDQGRLLSTVMSPRLGLITRLMLPQSDNYLAEMLTKDLGAYVNGRGSSAAGTAATATTLGRYLVPGDVIVDGSGLDRRNRLTPRSLVRILAAANADPYWGTPLIDSMARGGEGTLRRRFRSPGLRSRVRVKTGYIAGTSTLAGIVESPAGVRYAFALMMNDNSITDAKATQDRIVTLLASGIADTA